MICNKCGTQNSDGSKFCIGCGSELVSNTQPINNYQQPVYNQQPINNYQQPQYQQPQYQQPMYSQPMYTQPVYQQKKSTGAVIGVVIGVIALVIVGLYVIGLVATKAVPVAGKWNCKSFDGSGPKGDYIVTFEMKYDKTFRWEKYNDGKDNYVTGKYTFEKVDKSNNNTNYKYYKIVLNGDDFVDNGVKQTKEYNSQYEMGIVSGEIGNRQAILINPYSYNMYYCYED